MLIYFLIIFMRMIIEICIIANKNLYSAPDVSENCVKSNAITLKQFCQGRVCNPKCVILESVEV